jgi:DNA-binding NarL/FixJ family response regulator
LRCAARAIAAGQQDLQHLAPAAIAGAEAAALAGRADLAADATGATLALAIERHAPWIAGEHARAATRWERLGCPYEAALARGERGLSRGPRPSTRANPAGLTARRLEALRLVAHVLRNAEIARALVVSERTVDHHVGAILQKLDARSRTEATAHAVRLGLAYEDS